MTLERGGARLTPKQERFCEEYSVDCNGTQAAIRAGYSERTANKQASQLLAKPHVRARVDELLAAKAKRCEVDADWVLRNLKEVAERSMQAIPVLDREGNETGEYQFDSRGANRSLELLGRHLGLFMDRFDIKHSGGLTIVCGEEIVEIGPKEEAAGNVASKAPSDTQVAAEGRASRESVNKGEARR